MFVPADTLGSPARSFSILLKSFVRKNDEKGNNKTLIIPDPSIIFLSAEFRSTLLLLLDLNSPIWITYD